MSKQIHNVEEQYLRLLNDIVEEGVWVENKRTGVRCKTVVNRDILIPVFEDGSQYPLLTTRKTSFKIALAELIAYIRGYTNIAQFHALGTKTWDANANNPVWLANPNRQGEGDLGYIYGAAPELLRGVTLKSETTQSFPFPKERPNFSVFETKKQKVDDSRVDMFDYIYRQLLEKNDDRGLIWNFWYPMLQSYGCLRPCLYEHQFTLLDDTLYLNSTQRSQDVPLGGAANIQQCYLLLWLMCQITGLKPGYANLKIVNAHVYENQLPFVEEQLSRKPYKQPKLVYKGDNEMTYESLRGDDTVESQNWLHPDMFEVQAYQHHPAIKYPFTV